MKKLICIVLALCLVMALAACGNSEKVVNNGQSAQTGKNETPAQNNDDKQDAPAPQETPSEAGFVFTYNGTNISMNAPAADILTALGEPKSMTEEPSCAFDGMDKTFYYGSFYLATYPMPEGDYVYSVWLVDDSITTAEGLYIGATQAEAEKAYGAENYNGSNAYIVTKGDSKLTVLIEGGVVSSIQYDAIVM